MSDQSYASGVLFKQDANVQVAYSILTEQQHHWAIEMNWKANGLLSTYIKASWIQSQKKEKSLNL